MLREHTFDDVTAEASTGLPAEAFVDAWHPKLTPGRTLDRGLVAASRRIVTEAGARNQSEARTVASRVLAYLTWRTDQGRSITRGLWNLEQIDAFLDDQHADSPTGTRNAIRSHLRRCDPAVGLAGTTRTTLAGTATDAAGTSPAGAPAADEVAEAIDRYVPQRIDATRWARVAELVRDAVRACEPERVLRATDLLRTAAYLAAWCDHHNRPLRGDVVFDPTTIEEFLADVARDPALGSVATYAANLHAIRERLGIDLGDTVRREWGARPEKDPYTRAEIAVLADQLEHIPTAKRRTWARAAVALIIGAGASPLEAGWARPGDITSDEHGTWVRLTRPERWDTPASLLAILARPAIDPSAEASDDTPSPDRLSPGRRVLVAEPWANWLRAAALWGIDHDEAWLLGGTVTRRNKRLSELMQAHHHGRFVVEFDSTRGRRTWMVHALAQVADTTFGSDRRLFLRALRTQSVLGALERGEP